MENHVRRIGYRDQLLTTIDTLRSQMMRKLSFCLLALCAVSAVANDNTNLNSPEFEVLSRYVGTWDVTFDFDDPFSEGTLTAKRVLDGAYLEHTGEFQSRFVRSHVRVKTLTTYDAIDKKFKRWSFASNGRAFESSGTWDQATKTMTWISEQFEQLSKLTIKTTSIERFRNDGSIEVSKLSTDPNREVGRSTEIRMRRK